MKNFRLLSVVASLMMMTATIAQNTNSIFGVDASVRKGKTGDLVIKYQFDKADTYASFEFTISLPEGITISTEKSDIYLHDALNAIEDYSVRVSSQANNTYKVTGYSDPAQIITGLSGSLLTLKLIADPVLAVGANLDAAIINNAYLSTIGGVSVDVASSSFNISIVEVPTIILDETSLVEPETAEGVNVKVIRTINANEWSTICLPFEISEDKMASAFGDDVVVGDFTGCDPTITDDNIITSIKVNFSSASKIEANHPYIIKVSSPIESFIVNDVNISPTEEPSVDNDEFRTGKGTARDPYVYYYNSFVGTYVANTVVPEFSLFLNGNNFWYSTGNTKMKAFRGYFEFYDILTEIEEAPANITLAFDEADGINNLTVGQPVEGIYDIQGRKVHTDENKPLKKGVYIINGKKVVR